VLLGHPSYEVIRGTILFKGQEVTHLPPHERARLGMFLAFQYPVEVPGVSVLNFLRTSLGAIKGEQIPVRRFREIVQQRLTELGMDLSFARRNLNEGFSGGEKKRCEVLQLSVLEPELAILDETDSGLDIDALQTVAAGVNALRSPDRSFVIVTHYQRLLNFIVPDHVHVMMDGRLVKSGGKELALELEEKGYGWLEEQFAAKA
jgi:Fe-S cluster assembly ATP-binding protein